MRRGLIGGAVPIGYRWVALLVLVFSIWVCMAGADAQGGRVDHVFIVSIDGLRPDVLIRAQTPNIDNLLKVGSYTWAAQTVQPSVTLPSHCSMVTGVTPQRHGVTWNDYQPGRGALPVPTVFTIAKAHGLTSAIVVAKEKLQTLALDRSVDTVRVVAGNAVQVAQAAAGDIEARQPSVVLVHFADVDGAGHGSGWGSNAQVAATQTCDQGLGLLLGAIHRSGLAARSVMIVTSDHGGHGRGHGTDQAIDMTIPWICAGTGVAAGQEIRTRVTVCDTAAMALYAIGIVPPADWDGHVVPGVFPRRG